MQTNELYHFLSAFKVEKGDDFTHTSFLRPSGAFYIPSSHAEDFYKLYKRSMTMGEDLYITEKHRPVGPVVIDLDFRFPCSEEPATELDFAAACTENGGIQTSPSPYNTRSEHRVCSDSHPARQYNEAQLESMVCAVCRCVSSYVDCPTEFSVYVMEKPHPVQQRNVIKDGMHMVIPEVVTRPSVQYLIRDALIADPAFKDTIASLRLLKGLEDVVDKDVIEKNNWFMYGSKKPNAEPYAVTRTFAYRVNHLVPGPELPPLGSPGSTERERHAELSELLSIRNKYTESPLRTDRFAEVAKLQQQMDDKVKKRQAVQHVMSGTAHTRTNTSEFYECAKTLVGMLDVRRTENYGEWIRLGWCLRNIDYRLLDTWEEFSKQSTKYIIGECGTLWQYMRQGGLGIGTLHMWAKHDSPDRYKEMIRNDLFDLIHKSLSATHYDVACVVHHMYRYDYACASIRNRTWFEFRNHRWHTSDSAVSLNHRLSTEVFREYINVCSFHNHKIMATENEAEQLAHAKTSQDLNKVAQLLKRGSFKKDVLNECAVLFYVEKFEDKLDQNRDLLGFENGVYDLDNLEFREGRPDDFISFSTGINYVPYDKDDISVKEIHHFYEKVLPNENVRKYVFTLLSSFLSGHTREERFHIWTGSGCNGKSKVIDLFEMTLGEYCCKLPVTLLTQKRAASNAASGEITRAKGKRFACLQEPSEDERLNIGLMKELTGGDKIMARPMYKEPIEFRPMFKMLLLCNHLPNVPSDDGGTWRRIRLVHFPSKFVAYPPTRENEYPIDTEISKKFERWAPHFMAILLEHYKNHFHSTTTIQEPDEVLACTREYQKDNDHYTDFMDTCLERSPDDSEVLMLDDVFKEFQDWVRSDNIPIKIPKKKDVKNYLDKNLGKSSTAGRGVVTYRGFRLRDRYGGVYDANNNNSNASPLD